MSQTEVKYFTPREANNTLPLVRQIVKDILNNAYQIKTIAESLGGHIQDSEEIKQLSRQIDSFIRELNEIGCFFKDWNFQIGLVDFPAIIDGEEVSLCWRSDENSVDFFHSLEDGYAGRKPIPPDYF
ncbi:MAG: DUF2203 domain-containing protein [Ignavibacteriae bacterium HGW-Ignavibacteriae-3]|nr:MAG: DUF2203 domain-containing protein [Ignavibacteriae bacterium HGW-Ignavibacteriae-3]